jgi:hypothetical protein
VCQDKNAALAKKNQNCEIDKMDRTATCTSGKLLPKLKSFSQLSIPFHFHDVLLYLVLSLGVRTMSLNK